MRLSVRNVRKSFGPVEVLHGVSLEATPGEFIALVGKSGCGKSTLLRLLAGLEAPTGGRIECDNRPVIGPGQETRMMFQDARLLPWKRVLDNVGLGLKQDRKARAERALSQVGLLTRAAEWPAVLSGGQRQRVALARALASEPGVLLLDEPLGALDALTRLEMQWLLESLWRERRFTAVLVTHDVEEAVALADRVLVLDSGCITLDRTIRLPRPRQRADTEFGNAVEEILGYIMSRPGVEDSQSRHLVNGAAT
jgi:sulfonate transport system ATP-binding protein